jgi:glycosyltransferase involved in cell wall biosynthesis
MSHIHLVAQGPEPADSAAYLRMPHVLFVLDCFPKALGGGERVALRLASLLPQYGFRASILTLALHADTAFRPELAPCPVYLLPLTSAFNVAALRGAFALSSFLRHQEIRIVQTFFESSDLWAGMVTRLSSDAKLVWSRRDMGILRQPKHQIAYRMLHNLPHRVFAVSHRVASHVRDVDEVASERVHVVHNGLEFDTSATTKAPRPANPVITTIGNIRKVKGHDVLLEAAIQVVSRRADVVFKIAGEVLEPDFFQQLQARIAASGLTNNFCFLGHVTDLRKQLEDSSIFVLPSRSEGFSNALLEAMAAGLPCIATDVGGNAEAIDNDESGFIIPSEAPALLAEKILWLLEHPEEARRLGAAAQRRIERDFTSEAMVTKVAHEYRILLRSS